VFQSFHQLLVAKEREKGGDIEVVEWLAVKVTRHDENSFEKKRFNFVIDRIRSNPILKKLKLTMANFLLATNVLFERSIG
jgi:hypothetical protein